MNGLIIMYFSKKKTQTQQIIELKHKIEELNNYIEARDKSYKELYDVTNKSSETLKSDARSLPIAINFAEINAFSIERMVYNGVPTTVIGYRLQDRTSDGYTNIIKEWYFYCDDKIHIDLVKQFEAYKKSKEGRAPY